MDYRLFLVDDSKLLCRRLEVIFSTYPGLQIVGQAHSYAAAVDSIKRLRPDIAILDIHMPDGSGIDVLKQIRADKLDTTVIIFTHYPYPQYRKECLDAGADYFFDKDAEFHDLFKTVRQLTQPHPL